MNTCLLQHNRHNDTCHDQYRSQDKLQAHCLHFFQEDSGGDQCDQREDADYGHNDNYRKGIEPDEQGELSHCHDNPGYDEEFVRRPGKGLEGVDPPGDDEQYDIK